MSLDWWGRERNDWRSAEREGCLLSLSLLPSGHLQGLQRSSGLGGCGPSWRWPSEEVPITVDTSDKLRSNRLRGMVCGQGMSGLGDSSQKDSFSALVRQSAWRNSCYNEGAEDRLQLFSSACVGGCLRSSVVFCSAYLKILPLIPGVLF